MSNFARAPHNNRQRSLKLPVNYPIPYKRAFTEKDLPTVKIEVDRAFGQRNNRKCKVFDGTKGVEALLFCREGFDDAAEELGILNDPTQFKKGYERTLSESAKDTWRTIVAEHPFPDPPTIAHFNGIYDIFVSRIGGRYARDDMWKFFRSSECRKPFATEVREHVNRMGTIKRYTNLLPGREPIITEASHMNHVVESFPEKWQMEFLKIHPDGIGNMSMDHIISFFEAQKRTTNQLAERQARKQRNRAARHEPYPLSRQFRNSRGGGRNGPFQNRNYFNSGFGNRNYGNANYGNNNGRGRP